MLKFTDKWTHATIIRLILDWSYILPKSSFYNKIYYIRARHTKIPVIMQNNFDINDRDRTYFTLFTPLSKTHALPSFITAVMTIWSSTVGLKSTYNIDNKTTFINHHGVRHQKSTMIHAIVRLCSHFLLDMLK